MHFVTNVLAPTFVAEFAAAVDLLDRFTAELRYYLRVHARGYRERNQAADAICTTAALIRRSSAPCCPPPELLRLAAAVTIDPVPNLDAFAASTAALVSCCHEHAVALAPLGLGAHDIAALENALRRLESAHRTAGMARQRRARLGNAQVIVANKVRESCAHIRRVADLTYPAHQVSDDPTIAEARQLFGLDRL